MKNACHDLGVARVPISRVNGASTIPETDAISVEEPLALVTAESEKAIPFDRPDIATRNTRTSRSTSGWR